MESWAARIRAARPSDAAALAALSTEFGYPSNQAQVRERLRLLDDPERTVLVAEADDGVAGFVNVHVQRHVELDPFAELGGLIVAPGHRREGLGAALFVAAAEWARARDLSRIVIRSGLSRAGAQEFYEGVGCRVLKDQRVYEYPL